MGNQLCARPQPVDFYRATEALSTDDEERDRICEWIHSKKMMNTPVLVIEKNELLRKRRETFNEKLQVVIVN
jgi:hypothetical protein